MVVVDASGFDDNRVEVGELELSDEFGNHPPKDLLKKFF